MRSRPGRSIPRPWRYLSVIARLLNMKVVDEVQTMRKMVIDGSNTSGFQRTAYVGSDGKIETTRGAGGHRHPLPGGGGGAHHRGPRGQHGLLPRPAGNSAGGDRHGSGHRLAGARSRGRFIPGNDPALHRPRQEGPGHHPPGCECLHQGRSAGGGQGSSGPEPGRQGGGVRGTAPGQAAGDKRGAGQPRGSS
ncbi:MAG: hypothetical protein MZV64_50510 [Ignavibacteriales bacterium]|nr:hypothetical protein [Ignavibacteriales bacterium]